MEGKASLSRSLAHPKPGLRQRPSRQNPVRVHPQAPAIESTTIYGQGWVVAKNETLFAYTGRSQEEDEALCSPLNGSSAQPEFQDSSASPHRPPSLSHGYPLLRSASVADRREMTVGSKMEIGKDIALDA